MMNKFLARQGKDTAPIAKITSLPAETAWYAFHGTFSNELGQALISELFLVSHNLANGQYRCHMQFSEFLRLYKLKDKLISYDIPEEDIKLLEEYKADAVSYAHMMHLGRLKDKLVSKMERQYANYHENLTSWYKRSKNAIGIAQNPKEKESPLAKRNRERRERRTDLLMTEHTAFCKNLTSLSGMSESEDSESGAYIKLMAVFYNQ